MLRTCSLLLTGGSLKTGRIVNFKYGTDRYESQIQIPHPPNPDGTQKDANLPQVYTTSVWVRPGPQGMWC